MAAVESIRTPDRAAWRGSDAPVRMPRRPGRRSRTTGEVELRGAGEIESIRDAGRVVRAALDAAVALVREGATPLSVEAAISGVLASEHADPVFQGWRGSPRESAYPSACCVSVNAAVAHGIPDARRFEQGDLVSIDVGVRLRGWCADGATTVLVGEGDPAHAALLCACRESLDLAISMVRPGVRWSSIAAAMQELATGRGFALVTEFAGHGVGRELHESPEVPGYITRGLLGMADFTLLPGMVLAIEPLLVAGPDEGMPTVDLRGCARGVELRVDADGWTVRTASGRPGAHMEATVAVVRDGADVLTAGRGGAAR